MSSSVKILVISLKEQQDRRSDLINRLSRIIDFEFVDAIRGADLLAQESTAGFTRQLFSGRIGRMLRPAEIGCALSHQKALETFMQTGLQWGLILEDDVQISPYQRDMIFELVELLADHSDCELVKVGGFGEKTAYGRVIAEGSAFSLLNVVTFGVCAHGYLVSRRGAEKLIRTIDPITEPFDIFLRSAHRHECSIFETAPWLVSLRPDHLVSSTIDPERLLPEGAKVLFYLKFIGFFEKRFYNLRKWRHGVGRFGLKYIFKKRMLSQFSTSDFLGS